MALLQPTLLGALLSVGLLSLFFSTASALDRVLVTDVKTLAPNGGRAVKLSFTAADGATMYMAVCANKADLEDVPLRE